MVGVGFKAGLRVRDFGLQVGLDAALWDSFRVSGLNPEPPKPKPYNPGAKRV